MSDMISIVTPLYRKENYEALKDSIVRNALPYFKVKWYVVEDSDVLFVDESCLIDGIVVCKMGIPTPTGDRWGHKKRNMALDHIADGYVYFLDDDNLIHPKLFKFLRLDYTHSYQINQFSQDGTLRLSNVFDVAIGYVDIGSMVVLRSHIGDFRLGDEYEADGIMFEKIFSDPKKLVEKHEYAMAYYNAISADFRAADIHKKELAEEKPTMDYVISYKDEHERSLCLKWFIENRYRIDPNKKTVVFLSVFDLPSRQYRITDAMRGLAIHYPDKFNLVLCEKAEDVDKNNVDILFMSRIDGSFLKLIDELRETGKTRFVFDMDDSLYRDKNHPTEKIWVDLMQDKLGEELAIASDCVIVTQNKLKDQFKKFNPNVFVVRNSIDFNLPQWSLNQSWLKQKNDEGKTVIGWAGGSTHLNVLLDMAKFLKPLHDKYSHLHFVIAGLPTEDYYIRTETNETEGYVEVFKARVPQEHTFANKVKQTYSDFDPSRIDFLYTLPMSEYGKFFSMFNINLAYLHDNDFNHCKSENKIIEGLAYGAIPVYSYVGGYREFHDALPIEIRTTHCRIFNNNADEWIRKLSHIVENIDWYSHIAMNMSHHIKNKYSIKYATDNRVAIFDELIKTLKP